MRILVITANLGGIDYDLKNVEQVTPADWTVTYVNYNDNNFFIRRNSMLPRMRAKMPKMLAHEYHPGYDYYLWMDGTIRMKNPNALKFIIDYCGTNEIALFKHPHRSSIIEEENYITMNIKESPRLIDRYADEPLRQQVKFYYSHPDFKDDCLYACGVFAYSKKLQNDFQLMRDWFYHNARYSIMDQISLPFLLWRNHTSISLITENIYSNQYFEYCGHRIKKWHYSNIALRIKKSVVRRLFPQSTA